MKLFIAVPSYKFIQSEFIEHVFNLLSTTTEGRVIGLHAGDGLAPRQRNQIASRFLDSDFTHLLMIDSDILPTPENVDRIASHGEVDVVGGFYCVKKQSQTVWVANHWKKDEKPDERGLVRVENIGTGFMLINRKTLETLKNKGYAKRYIVDGTDTVEHEFFPLGVYKGRYRSEDWAFCDMVHLAGMKVYGDTKCVVRHVGSAIYPLDQVQQIENLRKIVGKLREAGTAVPKEIIEA